MDSRVGGRKVVRIVCSGVLAAGTLAISCKQDMAESTGRVKRPAAPSPATSTVEAFSTRLTRKEGSQFQCSASIRLSGKIKKSPSLTWLVPIFSASAVASWHTVSTFQFDSAVLRHDDTTVTERWDVKRVQALKLVAPPDLLNLGYELGPAVRNALMLAVDYAVTVPDPSPTAETIGILCVAAVEGQKVEWAPFAKVFGLDAKVLEPQQRCIGMAGRILGEWQGKAATVSIRNDRVSWGYAEGATDEMQRYFNSISSLVDYTLVPNRTVRIGEQFAIDRLLLTQLLPPSVTDLPDYEVKIIFKRMQDESVGNRLYARFDGIGDGRVLYPDGTLSADFKLDSARMLIDITDHQNLFLHKFEVSAPLAGRFLQKQTDAIKVDWKGDVRLLADYEVNLVEGQ